jgi:hypothetical protein
METCKSPRKVMRAAYALASEVLPEYSHKFSRHDFTLPQLFACLVIREHQKKSYRGTEALLRDCPEWLADVGMTKVPDHNTLCRAFRAIVTLRRTNKFLDVTAAWFTDARVLRLSQKPLAADSTHFESHHVSRHFEHRRKQAEKETGTAKAAGNADKIGSQTRSGTVKKLPKATFAVAAGGHVILAVLVGTGAGSDASTFDPLLAAARRRAPGVKTVVADAGFDSEANHRLARVDRGVRSIIPPRVGRPRKDGGPPRTRFRRLMHQRFRRKADKKVYGQRWQAETVNSMIKRNLGSALRATTAPRREKEMLLRAVVHNLMLAA